MRLWDIQDHLESSVFFWSWSAIPPFLLCRPNVSVFLLTEGDPLLSLRQLTSSFLVKVKEMLPDDGCQMSVLFPFSICFPLGCVDCADTKALLFHSMLEGATLNYSVSATIKIKSFTKFHAQPPTSHPILSSNHILPQNKTSDHRLSFFPVFFNEM